MIAISHSSFNSFRRSGATPSKPAALLGFNLLILFSTSMGSMGSSRTGMYIPEFGICWLAVGVEGFSSVQKCSAKASSLGFTISSRAVLNVPFWTVDCHP